MKPGTRPVWIVLGCFLIACTAVVTTFTLDACRTGMLVVRVQEGGPHGSNVAVRIPAVLVPIALRVMPDEPLREVAMAARKWSPAFHKMTSLLVESPDCVLVRVDSSCESVDVRKQECDLIVDVSSLGEKVYVSIPLAVVDSVMKRLAEVMPSS